MSWNPTDVSVREQALRAVVDALAGVGTPAAVVTRSNVDQVRTQDLPCFDVSPGLEKDGANFEDAEAWSRELEVKVRAVLDAADQDDGALDPFYLFAVRQLMADHTLGGVVDDVAWDGADAVFRPDGRDVLGLELTFRVTFSVKRGDPAQKG